MKEYISSIQRLYGDNLKEERKPTSIIVTFEGRYDTYTIYGDIRNQEIVEIVDGLGDDISQSGAPNEPALDNIAKAVNLLLSPRITIEVS